MSISQHVIAMISLNNRNISNIKGSFQCGSKIVESLYINLKTRLKKNIEKYFSQFSNK
jgi:hypothetical protein